MSYQINHITIYRQKQIVIDDLSFGLQTGEFVGILGANGAGKSTLIAAMAGELDVPQGAIHVADRPIKQWSALEQSQRRAVLPQNPSLTFDLTVQEIVQMGAYPYATSNLDDVATWVDEALVLADLLSYEERIYTHLSGGEQQRVQIARVLVQCLAIEMHRGEAYLLLDEPLTGLDPKYQMHFMRMFEMLATERAIGIVMVMHDLNMAARYAQRLILLHEGRLIAQGPPEEVLTPPLLKLAYGLDCTVLTHPLDANRLLVLC